MIKKVWGQNHMDYACNKWINPVYVWQNQLFYKQCHFHAPEKEGGDMEVQAKVVTWLQPALTHSTALSPEMWM